MIPTASSALYTLALENLGFHKRSIGRGFKGRFIQVFLGLKFFQNSLPSMYSGAFVTTEVLQSLLDDLYAKVSRPPNDCVLSLFEQNYLARTGLQSPGNSYAQNTWRNNFNLQKGIGCYAPEADLSSMTFLDEERSACRHLAAGPVGNLQGAHCSFCPSGAAYRGEAHRKWLRIDPGGSGYAVTDLQRTDNFVPYLAPENQRIPIFPLIIALYHDSDPGLVLGTRRCADLSIFMADFNLSQREIDAYFDCSTTNPINRALMESTDWPKAGNLGCALLVQPTPTQGGTSTQIPQQVLPTPILLGTPTPPPAINSGWEAEQFVAAALRSDGWESHVVARQQLGYDIFAQKGSRKVYVEVKSSLGQCSPALTSREWQQASYHSETYVLSVLENFNPTAQNTIYWIPDPANRCVATQQTSITYSIPRSSWSIATVPLDQV